MRDPDLIVIILEAHFKLQRVVVATALFLHRVLEVRNVLTVAVPAMAAWFRGLLGRVEERFLPLIIRAVRFD